MTERAINAEPWTTAAPGMVKLQLIDCCYLVRHTASRGVERCPDCQIREQRRAARAAALAEAPH